MKAYCPPTLNPVNSMKLTWIRFKAFVMFNDMDSKDNIYPVRLAFCSAVMEDTFKYKSLVI